MARAPVKDMVDVQIHEGITAPWRQYFDSERRDKTKFSSINYSSSQILTSTVFGKVLKFDTGLAGTIVCTLPSVSLGHVDSWLIILKLGSGKLTIKAADFDTIESSVPGGRIVCDEPGRVIANVYLLLATETKWGIIGSTGIWRVY